MLQLMLLYTSDDGELSADNLTTLLNSTCTEILDSIAPLRSKCTKAVPEPWLNDCICSL